MRIVFLSGGARHNALRYLLQRGENVCAVVTPLLNAGNCRFKDVVLTAVEFGVPVFPVLREGVDDVIKRFAPDVIVSCGFPYILSKACISSARFAINVHPTLLPKYRGFRSGAYILINGEAESGITVHFLTAEMDRGDILVQKSFPLTPFDTPQSMYRKGQTVEPSALYEAIQLLKSESFSVIKQDESQASEYKAVRTPADSQVDPQRSLLELMNEIRACDTEAYPAHFYYKGQKVCIKLWRPDKSINESDMI
ncbi:methionyl-tRNA formyltransferase [Pseudomonas sp.]|jgi:methionyl-tRNA formyltransferase|uniref:methionyl-tRNA formyltransferase n=1 Tax=Pseudomonas sp. TaxID=306 RepID=UPI0039828AB2